MTLYYNRLSKRQIEMQAKSDKAPYDGREHSVSGFESDVFEFDGVKYTVTGLAASAAGTGAGTYKTSVSGTAKVTDPEGNDVTAQFDVTAAEGELVVAKRDVTLKPADAEKPYDGSALTASDFVVAAGSFAEGEGVESCTYAGSQTLVGQSASSIEHANALAGTDLENNYNVKYEEGKLTVTAAPDNPTLDDQSKDQGVFNGNDANSGLVQTGDMTGLYGMAAIIAAVVAAFVSLLAVRRRKK